MLLLEARVQVQALDKSLHLKQPLRAEGLGQTAVWKPAEVAAHG